MWGMLACRRRCLRTPCCTTRGPGRHMRLRWDCSSPFANTLILNGCTSLCHAYPRSELVQLIALRCSKPFNRKFPATHPITPLLTSTCLIAFTCVSTPYEMTSFWQMRLPWEPEDTPFATLPMALLTSVVRKEALLPEHTASFAATQLLPVVLAFTERHLASMSGRPPSTHVCQKLLVRAKLGSHWCCCRHCHFKLFFTLKYFKRQDYGTYIACWPFPALHGFAVQVMCSYLATSSALPVLLGHRELIKHAADMVHANKGRLPTSCTSLSFQTRQKEHLALCARSPPL